MGMVSTSTLLARRNASLPASSQGITFLGWFDDLRSGSGSAGNHFGITDHAGGGEDLDIGPGAGIAASRATATVGLYTVFRTTGPAFAGFASANIVTETGLCGIAIVSDATNVRSYYKVGTAGVLTAGGTVTATSFTPASFGINSTVNLAVGNWSLFNRALDPWEIDAQLNQRALCIPGALFYASGITGDTTTDESGVGNFTVDSGTQAAHAQDPGVGWRRTSRIYMPVAAESTGSGGSTSAAQVTAATGKATATAFGATTQAAQLTAATGAAAATGVGATAQGAQLTAGAGKATATGSGGSVSPVQATAGKGIGNEGTGEGGSMAAAQVAAGVGLGVATGTGGSSSPVQATAGKGAATNSGTGGSSSPAQVTGGAGAVEAVGSGGSVAAPQVTSGYNPGGDAARGGGSSQARRRLPPHRDY